jgi:hypothetical protein
MSLPVEKGTELRTDRLKVRTVLNGLPEYAGVDSFQPVAPDLSLAAGAGSADGADPSFLAAVMGNTLGADLTKDANYVGGVIGALSVTGTNPSTYPVGAVLGLIMDTVTDADGAVVAVIDGDSGVTKANAAFKAMSNNSTPGSGFDYGLDLHGAAHDGYSDLTILKADVRMSGEVCILNGAGAPTNGVTGATFAEIGSLYIDRTNGKAYINGGTKASPTWNIVTSA